MDIFKELNLLWTLSVLRRHQLLLNSKNKIAKINEAILLWSSSYNTILKIGEAIYAKVPGANVLCFFFFKFIDEFQTSYFQI